MELNSFEFRGRIEVGHEVNLINIYAFKFKSKMQRKMRIKEIIWI